MTSLRLPPSGVVAVDLESPSCDFIDDAFEFGVDAGFVESVGLDVVVDMFWQTGGASDLEAIGCRRKR